jgi:uncharacterized protein
MEQIEMLLDFQEADMEADALETEIRRSPNRIALKKNLDFLREQQDAVKQMEEQIAAMLDRVDVIKEAIRRQEEQLKALQKRMTDMPPESLDDTKAMQADAQTLLHDIHGYEAEMKRIQKEAADNERRHKEIIVRYAKVKTEYDQQKVDYETEYTEQMKKLDEKRKTAQDKGKGIDPKLMERYQIIKKHSTPPVVKLINGQCGGCYMSLPSVTLRNLKAGSDIIDCESCGRMIVPM